MITTRKLYDLFVDYIQSGHVIINYDVYGYPPIFPLRKLWINTLLPNKINVQLGTQPKWVIRKYE